MQDSSTVDYAVMGRAVYQRVVLEDGHLRFWNIGGGIPALEMFHELPAVTASPENIGISV